MRRSTTYAELIMDPSPSSRSVEMIEALRVPTFQPRVRHTETSALNCRAQQGQAVSVGAWGHDKRLNWPS
jgi:hypothetical protein